MAALLLTPAMQGYSVLTHEAIIDSAWDASIKPLLLKRFPNATPDDLVHAHAYAYGGCIIQDMGYYPFGSHFFSDLVHYVRTGDFVTAMIADSQDLDEYAFALGSLAHYAADNQGHSVAVNPSVALEYPKLEARYGKSVTYADDPTAHLRVEFGFDVLQVARGAYAPKSYHDFIGFEVSKPLLERAFRDTYSLELKDIFTSVDLALGTYRHAVASVIPEMTKVAWKMKKKELMKANPKANRKQFVYNLSRASYHKEWDGEFQRPGIGARVLAFVFRILPKVGPLQSASFKPPTPETTKWFEDSFDKSLSEFRGLLSDVSARNLRLPNRDFDTGKLTAPTEYQLADDTYAKLAVKLADHDPGTVDPKLRANILSFYRNLDLPYATKKKPEDWDKTVLAIGKLRTQATQGE
ncbi:MAG TPA: zinc dependent phospholipase C family protein [Candidatus Sulfopaludibacter sp.]|jgi:hypothetical protein|nr:zinc dependent phospholipase C family protein [Candidatus Sulfopaludibacter sp.]